MWERFLAAMRIIHARIGSNDNIGMSMGRLLAGAGFREIQVRVVLSAPSTVGWRRFGMLVSAMADTGVALFPGQFDQKLARAVKRWACDRAGLIKKDPFLCSAIANGTKP